MGVNNMLNKIKKDNKGFTLIEILIVVVVIGILAGVMLRAINVEDVRRKTRDSQRISDLKKFQTALELYFVDHRTYPSTTGWVEITGSDSLSTLLLGSGAGDTYINQIPTDPKPALGANYMYRSESGTSYYLVSVVELSDNFDDSPCTDNPYTIADIGCYEVQNPL